MSECKFQGECAFFNDRMDELDVLTPLFKMKFCRSDNAKCARYLIASEFGLNKTLENLYPIQLGKAKELLKNAGVTI